MIVRRQLERAAWPIAVLLCVSGCAGQGNAENTNAAVAATTFLRAVGDDSRAACALLAPQTLQDLEEASGPCPQSLPAQVPGAEAASPSVQVYGKDAIVTVGQDTVFLARFATGWRVTAAGCTRHPDLPYDCKVKGG